MDKTDIKSELRRLLVMSAVGHPTGLEGAAADIASALASPDATFGASALLDGLNIETSPLPDLCSATSMLRSLVKMSTKPYHIQPEIGRLHQGLQRWAGLAETQPGFEMPEHHQARKYPSTFLTLLTGGEDEAHRRRQLMDDVRKEIARQVTKGIIAETIDFVTMVDQTRQLRFIRQAYFCDVHQQRFWFWRAEEEGDERTPALCARCLDIMAMAFKTPDRQSQLSVGSGPRE